MAREGLGLSIYLLRKERVWDFEQRFPRDAANAVPLADGIDGRFIPLPSADASPEWVSGVRPLLAQPPPVALVSQSAGALLAIARGERTFVISFGHGWQRLDDGWLEPDFGRRVALNLIKPDGLLEIRAEQVFAKWHVASDRAPRASRVDDFGVEFDRDLVAAVEGVPRKPKHGRTIRGATSLRLRIPVKELVEFLDRCDGWYQSDAYKKHWPEIDNLIPVRDSSILGKLEMDLDSVLADRRRSRRVVMFAPAFRRAESFAGDSFVYGRLTQHAAKRPYLATEQWFNYLDEKGLSASVAEARRNRVHVLTDGDEGARQCTVFDCFGYEGSHNGRQYVLSSGVWYEVVDDFLKRVNRAVQKIAAPPIQLPAWNQVETEAEYNARCCEKGTMLLFDAKNIRFGGGQSQFEFCDVFHPRRKTLFFAKIGSRSSGMSHLIEQVRRTAELLFAADGEYREVLTRVFRSQHPGASTAWLESRPRPGDWKLCLVSLGRSARDLPFFAKCSLMKLHKELLERGHSVYFGGV